MKFASNNKRGRSGIALVIVMISIFVLAMLAAGFAISMKTETRLAQYAYSESELQWLGRSGVNWARWILAQQLAIAQEPYDSLDQVWAGGMGGVGTSNSPLANLPDQLELGKGVVKRPKISDLERKWNINHADEAILQQALNNMGVDAGEMTVIANRILDWIDPNDDTRVQGAESDAYQNGPLPHDAKNGPIDDISELLYVIPSEIYYGFHATNMQESAILQRMNQFGRDNRMVMEAPGFQELFTPISSGKININTASESVLMLIPGIDQMTAQSVVAARGGSDDGSGLTGPFRNLTPNYLWSRVQGLNLEMARRLQQYCDVRSRTFEVEVEVSVGGSTRKFYAILGRNNQRDVQILSFYWKD